MNIHKTVVVLLALLLAGMVMVPIVSAENNSVSEEEKNMVRSDNPSDVYYKDILITQMGTLPEVTDALTSSKMYFSPSVLQKVTDDSVPGLEKFSYPNGPVIGYGYDKYGTMDVQINKESTVSPSEIQEIYSVIQNAGEKNGIHNIPCKFLSLGLIKMQARTDRIRPVIGGLQIASDNGWGTSGFRARDSNGNLGFVTAGHLGYLNSAVYQPDQIGSYYAVGTISKLGTTNSDSAFIPYSNTDPSVYWSSSVTLDYSTYTDPQVNDVAYKSGAATDVTAGQVALINRCYNPYLGKYLPQQAYAPYSSSDGDSGAPVFKWVSSNAVLLGIHMGQADPGFGVFSPISGINSDLGITPAL